MKKSRKIFVAAVLVVVTAFSISLTVAAAKTNNPEAFTGNDSDISVSNDSDVGSDETPDYSDYEEPVKSDSDIYVYIDKEFMQTSKGATVCLGIYKRYHRLDGRRAEMNYGVSAGIVDINTGSTLTDLKGEFMLDVKGAEREEIYFIHATADSCEVYYDFPVNYNLLAINSKLTFRSEELGSIDDRVLNVACRSRSGYGSD